MDWVKKYYESSQLPQWKSIHLGWDIARKGGDETVICIRGGKAALVKEIIRKAKRKGYRVLDMRSSGGTV